MRLLNTRTLTLHEFFDNDIPPYAILSHRWDESEVTFQQLSAGKGPETQGWEKVAGCCAKAASDGWEHVWIDSCCIDKTSSAELSESINSMFKWYQSSQVCYAYLSDVTTTLQNPYDHNSEFQCSQWFTRGWTLQELLAPRFVEFYDRSWLEIGTKSAMCDLLSGITGITHVMNFSEASVAQKMSWASKRVTKRLEDEAYCLMGIFDVNMPTLYGEGRKAFLRLQLEILNRTDDDSIFAWETPWEQRNFAYGMTGGLLASSAAFFKESGDIIQDYTTTKSSPSLHVMTNRGMRVELPTLPQDALSNAYVEAWLNCVRKRARAGDSGFTKYRIALQLAGTAVEGVFTRQHILISNFFSEETQSLFRNRLIYVEQKSIDSISTLMSNSTKFIVKFQSTVERTPTPFIGEYIRMGLDKPIVNHSCFIKNTTGTFVSENMKSLGVASVTFHLEHSGWLALILGNHVWNAWIDLVSIDYSYSEKSWCNILQNISMEYEIQPKPDRISRRLADGSYISAALKQIPSSETGENRYGVSIGIDKKRQWPSPADNPEIRSVQSLMAPSLSSTSVLGRALNEVESSEHPSEFCCRYPGPCKDIHGSRTSFKTASDREQHYRLIHGLERLFVCDYPNCFRGHDETLLREDDFRDHLLEYHKEDFGDRKSRTYHTTQFNKKIERKRPAHVSRRGKVVYDISPHYWRCERCLVTIFVEVDGWSCSQCSSFCEETRKNARLTLLDKILPRR